MQQYYQIFIQYISLMAQYEPLTPVITKILEGASKFVEQILRTFDIKDPETYIPRIDDIGSRATTQPQSAADELTSAFLNGAAGESEGSDNLMFAGG